MIRTWPLWLVLAQAAGAEPLRPAELPPPDYAGLQYVDSQGCLFARAGTEGEVLWIPRVARDGTQVCGYPPSGHRVPVAAIGGETVAGDAGPAAGAEGGYFVAVGSFSHPDYADRAEARLAELDYATVRGRVQGKSGTLTTIFAGPFTTAKAAEAARKALQGEGFPDAELVGP